MVSCRTCSRASRGQYPRLAISLSQPSERPKLGHDVSLIHTTAWSEQHISQTAGDPELKHNLNFRAGDHPGTAEAIAYKVGILWSPTARKIEEMNAAEGALAAF